MTLVYCDDCPWTGDSEELVEIKDLHERVDAGGIMPHGQCRHCGALCYELFALGNVETETYAVLNMQHITQNDSALLSLLANDCYERPDGILLVEEDEHHYRVKVSDVYCRDRDVVSEKLHKRGFSQAAVELLTAAIMDTQIRGIIFDRDGILYARFPSFDW